MEITKKIKRWIYILLHDEEAESGRIYQLLKREAMKAEEARS